jgi:hypothetical protein
MEKKQNNNEKVVQSFKEIYKQTISRQLSLEAEIDKSKKLLKSAIENHDAYGIRKNSSDIMFLYNKIAESYSLFNPSKK